MPTRRPPALNALSARWRVRDADVKMLSLFATAGKADLQFKLVHAAEVLNRMINGDEGRHVSRQALLEIGGLERGSPHGDRAMRRRRRQADRRQRTGGAVLLDAG